ncbi:MAG: hypothetical protein FWH20_06135 [Oscillospiraceae bacterium]|nr:hypothetical protein [Oscillospiraceae bacterium]
MQAYEGYYEGGYIHTKSRKIKIPPKEKIIILFNRAEEQRDDSIRKRHEAWAEIEQLCSNIQPRPDFDEKAELAEYREEKYGRIN